jgi:hypothetical protein
MRGITGHHDRRDRTLKKHVAMVAGLGPIARGTYYLPPSFLLMLVFGWLLFLFPELMAIGLKYTPKHKSEDGIPVAQAH